MDRNLRIRMLLEGADRLTRPMREAAGGSSRLSQALRVTRDRMKEIERAQADIGDFRQLKTGLAETSRRMQEAQARTTQLGRAIAQTENPTKKMRREFEQARREAARLTSEHEQQSGRLQTLRARMAAAGVSTRDLASHERRLRTEAASTNDTLRQQEQRLQQLADRSRRLAAARNQFSQIQGTATGLAAGGAAAVGTGMVIARPLEDAVNGAMEYESVMTDINQKVNQTREAGRRMGKDLQVAALAVNQMPADLQKGVDALTGFGLGGREATDMMTPIGRAATAYKAQIEDLSRASFAAHDNLKVPIDQTAKAIDVMAQAGKSGAFEVKDMAQYFPELTASMQSLGSKGVPAVADLAAALQITRKGAGDSAGAANNLQNLISKINAGDTIKNFAKFGIDIPAAMKKAAKDGRSPIEEIVRLTQQATGGDQAKLSTLFGDMQVQQALRPLMSAFKEYQAIRADALGANGTVNTDFADRMNDGAEKVKRLQIQSKLLKDTIGAQLMPTVASMSGYLSGWAARIADVAKRHPNLTRGIALAAGFMAALFVVLGGGAIIIAGLVAPFAALAGAATLLGIGMLPLIGIVLGVTLGIGALAAAGYLIYAKWDAIAGWFGGIWSEITGYFSGGIAGISAFLLNFSPMGLLYGGIAALLNWLGIDVPSRLSQAGSDMIRGLINGITSMLGSLKSTIVDAAGSAARWFKEKLGIHSPSRVFQQFGGYMMQGLDGGIQSEQRAPIDRVKALAADISLAMAVGAATPAIASAATGTGAPPAMARGAPTSAAQPATYNLHFHGVTGSPQDIAQAVKEAMEQLERERRGRGFGDEGDD
ncbi:phage tail tape measure protein [Sphingobium sp. WCS2017Hpa-17]|uniref:phage tail tape measure protein n=1 Tax=Sphingobium sp. WCS2017Hpa-17 TaxID=3073638 RepID=UPI002889E394|nr:phage tail tape measure protein [Sphingobium sp. WCS2017Hpa-17]